MVEKRKKDVWMRQQQCFTPRILLGQEMGNIFIIPAPVESVVQIIIIINSRGGFSQRGCFNAFFSFYAFPHPSIPCGAWRF
jgi:hypothetical protein